MINPKASSVSSRNSNKEGVTSYLLLRLISILSLFIHHSGFLSWVIWWLYGPSPVGLFFTGCYYVWLTDLGQLCLILGGWKLWLGIKPLLLFVILEGADLADWTLDWVGCLFRRQHALPPSELGRWSFS